MHTIIPFLPLGGATRSSLLSGRGAVWQLFLATSPSVVADDIRGKYYVPIADPATPSAAAEDVAKRAEAMEWTLQELRDRGYLEPDSTGGRSVA